MRTTGRRAGYVVAWVAAAVVATGLGLAAVQLLGDGLGAVAAPTAALATRASAPTVDARAGSSAHLSTRGGDVYATCAPGGGRPVTSAVPAAGWTVDTSRSDTQVELRTGDLRIEVVATCTAGVPTLAGGDVVALESGPAEGSTAPTAAPTTAAAPSSASAPSSVDDHGGARAATTTPAAGVTSGNSGGGHGSDG